MKKKVILFFNLALVITLVLTACGSKTDENVLRVWITWGDNPQQIQELFNGFTEQTGIRVEVTAPVETDKLMTALTSSQPPDILVLSGGDLVKSYFSQNLVEPLNSWIDTAGINMDDIYTAPADQCLYQGEYLCLPWGTDIYALYWNKTLFAEAGLDPEMPPQTMEELVAYADQLTKYDQDGNLTQVGFIPDFSWSHTDLYVSMLGGFWYNPDGTELTLNSQPMVDSLLWQQQFYEKVGYEKMLNFIATLGDYSSSEHGFISERVAMMVEGEWFTGPNFIGAFGPDLNYGIAAFPPPADHPERAGTVVVQGTVALIPANATNKSASAQLLAWMLSPSVVAEEMYANYNLPTSRTAAQDPRFTSDPFFSVFIDLMGGANATYVTTTAISITVDDERGSIEEQVLHTGADPQTLLDDAQSRLSPLLQQALTP